MIGRLADTLHKGRSIRGSLLVWTEEACVTMTDLLTDLGRITHDLLPSGRFLKKIRVVSNPGEREDLQYQATCSFSQRLKHNMLAGPPSVDILPDALSPCLLCLSGSVSRI